jgi:FKBP-type peptidyl-prolyl cis-trans isomerase
MPAAEQISPADISAGSNSSMATQSQLNPLRGVQHSANDSKDALKARKAAEVTAKKNKEKAEEEPRRAEKAVKEQEKMEREQLEREHERAEKEHKQSKRTSVSRKLSLGLSGLVSWSRDKDKHASSVASPSSHLRLAEPRVD